MLLDLVLTLILILIVDVCICSMRSVNKTVFKPSTTEFIFGINILQVMFFTLTFNLNLCAGGMTQSSAELF